MLSQLNSRELSLEEFQPKPDNNIKELPNWHPSMLLSFRPIVDKQHFRVTRYEGHRPIPITVFKSGVW
jgi:hypothetical protein